MTPAEPERIAVHVTGDALRQIRGGHPWVWERSITRTSRTGAPGDLAVVFDEKRRFAAIGLWDPRGPIAVRILHRGRPRAIDDDFFAERMIAAADLRQPLERDEATTGYRLVHGENDALPGLVIDRYDRNLVVKLDTTAWVPHLAGVLAAAVPLTDAERVVLRAGRRAAADLPASLADGTTVIGNPPDGPVEFLEHGLRFEADVERGQKTGYFLDQRDNRALVGAQCDDADVLDVFCNTGGFSVHAAAGGARTVHSIDVSRHAVEATERHLALNRAAAGSLTRHTSSVADAFEAMAELVRRRVRYDVVIVDPPSFAPSASAVEAAKGAYRRLANLAGRLTEIEGTLFMASCSSRLSAPEFHEVVEAGLAEVGAAAVDTVRTGHALDHPIGFAQGAYLKAMTARIVAAD